LQFTRFAVKHVDTSVHENLTHAARITRLAVVITEHCRRRNSERHQFAREHTSLGLRTGVGEVAGHQEDVGCFRDAREEWLKRAR